MTISQVVVHVLCKLHVIVYCNIMFTYICVTLVHGLLDRNINTCNKHVILNMKVEMAKLAFNTSSIATNKKVIECIS